MLGRRAGQLLALALASGVTPALAAVIQGTAPTALVTDTSGVSSTVSDLTARYCAIGSWLGSAPTTTRRDLVFVLTAAEGRVTTEDTLEIPLASIRSIGLSDATDLWKRAKETGAPASVDTVRVDRRDGSQVRVISRSVGQKGPGDSMHYDLTETLEERAPDGTLIKRPAHSQVRIASGERFGRALVLCGFEGMAKAPSGKTGQYSIVVSEVRSIDFK